MGPGVRVLTLLKWNEAQGHLTLSLIEPVRSGTKPLLLPVPPSLTRAAGCLPSYVTLIRIVRTLGVQHWVIRVE